MSAATKYDTDTFATKADAIEDAESFYGVGATICYHGSDASGWTWEYVPQGAVDDDMATDHDNAVADAILAAPVTLTVMPYVSMADPTRMEIATLHPVNGAACNRIGTVADDMARSYVARRDMIPEGWQVIDTTSDGDLPSERKMELAEITEPELVTVKLSATVPPALVDAMRGLLRGAGVAFTLSEGKATAKPDKAPRAPRVAGVACHVDGLTWNIEALLNCGKDEGNYRQCKSMKARVDACVASGDLLALRALSWAGVPGHPAAGNTYQRQGATYRANWIAELTTRLAA